MLVERHFKEGEAEDRHAAIEDIKNKQSEINTVEIEVSGKMHVNEKKQSKIENKRVKELAISHLNMIEQQDENEECL